MKCTNSSCFVYFKITVSFLFYISVSTAYTIHNSNGFHKIYSQQPAIFTTINITTYHMPYKECHKYSNYVKVHHN